MESNKLFAETPPFKLFIRAALPGAIAMLASMLYDTADGILVGRYLGQESFGAVTIAIPLVILCFAVADLIGVGASAVIAVEHGKKNHQTANNIFTIAFIMLVTTGVISGIFFYFFAPNVLALMGAQGKIAEQGTIYLRVWTLFLPVMCISYAVDNFLKICGKIRRSTSIAFISAILGTVLEYYFLGVLGLSVEYAALGYCISITFSSLYGIWPFIGNKQILKFVKPHFNWTQIKEIFVNGFPIFMQNISSRIYSLLMNAALLSLGGDIAIASYGVLLYSGGLIQPLIYGQADAMQPAIGYNWGAKKKDRVLAIEKYIFSTGIIIGIFAFCVSFFFSEFLVKLYLPEGTQDLLNMAIPAMRIHAFVFIFSWITMCAESLAIALKQTKISNLLSIFMALIFPISSLLILRPFGLDALWYVSVVSNILSALLSVGCLIHIYRKHFKGVNSDGVDGADAVSDGTQEEDSQLTEAELAEAELAASELSSPEDHLDGESISRAQ